tara:strand:+ start:733 stop:1356 length:624 start_codon:yes stop_codon:yes gene_type:complete
MAEPNKSHQQYRSLMTNIRARHELVSNLNLKPSSDFVDFETAAFHLRKIIEGVAFGCLVATENGLKKIPRDARGQWNADKIFVRMKKEKSLVFPEAAQRVDPDASAPLRVAHHIVPRKNDNLAIDEVRTMYRQLHVWNHEWNPYVEDHGKNFDKRKAEVISFGPKLWNWLVIHMIGVGGELLIAHLKEGPEGQVLIAAATANHGLEI